MFKFPAPNFQEREKRSDRDARHGAEGQRRHRGHHEEHGRPQNCPDRQTGRTDGGSQQEAGRGPARHRSQEEGHGVGQAVLPGLEQQGQRSGETKRNRARTHKGQQRGPASQHFLCSMQLDSREQRSFITVEVGQGLNSNPKGAFSQKVELRKQATF